MTPNQYKSKLIAFQNSYDASHENAAVAARGEFIRSFPVSGLSDLKLEDYVIGTGEPTFCSQVEAKTIAWARIQGATASKFGIYYGKTNSDPEVRFRFTQKFGRDMKSAFREVKNCLLALIKSGKEKNFTEIDENPLSQMFKAKILSLYFPKIYINVCSAEYLEKIAMQLRLPNTSSPSERQHLIYLEKINNDITKNWSNPKFMLFLYENFFEKEKKPRGVIIRKPRKTIKRRVNFEDINAARNEIGKLSENFAMAWERDRLTGLGLERLAQKVEDRTDKPSYGYDFLSFNEDETERYIEVKSVGYDRVEQCHRFYISENEINVARSNNHGSNYYFYMVQYNRKGEPSRLIAKHASEIFAAADIVPCSFIVRLEIDS